MTVTVTTASGTNYILQDSPNFPAGMTQVKCVKDGTEKVYILHKPVLLQMGKAMKLEVSNPEKWDLNETIRTFPIKTTPVTSIVIV